MIDLPTPIRRTTLISAAAIGLVGLVAPRAFAHDIHPPVAEQGAWDYLLLGVTHMLQGWDHLLFVLGVLIVAESGRRAAGILTLFALGHSTTLIAAVLGGWRVSPELSDALVAASLVAVAAYGLRSQGRWPRVLAFGVFVFGLAHGLGLATRFQALPISFADTPLAVVLFNVGIEIGQLLAVAAMVVLALGARRLPQRLRDGGQRGLLVLIGVAGATATLWWILVGIGRTLTWPM